MLEFFESERGISEETLGAFGVGIDNSMASFPYPNGTKFRKHLDEGTRQFWSEPKGANLGLFTDKNAVSTPTMFLVEGETDTMRLYQELRNDGVNDVTVMGLPGIEAWQPDYLQYFRNAEQVYTILDNDEDYKTAQRVENCWHQIRRTLRPRATRIRLPSDYKDVCQFLDSHTVEGLRVLADSQQPFWHYEALDLNTEPGPIDWLVADLLARGDLVLMIGEPGVGKSWIGMTLAVAAASGQQSWLGRALNVPTEGVRVLYVDEENPEPLVYYRMNRLGLTKEAVKNVRFLHRQGVRLDRNPELLIDEAMDWAPDLIILDSLTRMHTKDENNAGEMAKLFNDGINPLARDTGATTLLLHHVTKAESPSAFVRARGSGDISAAIDTGLDVRQTDLSGGFNIVLYKSRWVKEGQSLKCRRFDEDGRTLIEADTRRVF